MLCVLHCAPIDLVQKREQREKREKIDLKMLRPNDKKKEARLSLPQHRVRTKQLPVITDLDLYEFEKVFYIYGMRRMGGRERYYVYYFCMGIRSTLGQAKKFSLSFW